MFDLADFPLLLFLWQRRTCFYYRKWLRFFCCVPQLRFPGILPHCTHYKGRGEMHTHYIFRIIYFIVLHLFDSHLSFIKQFNNKSISIRWLNGRERPSLIFDFSASGDRWYCIKWIKMAHNLYYAESEKKLFLKSGQDYCYISKQTFLSFSILGKWHANLESGFRCKRIFKRSSSYCFFELLEP